MAAAWIKRSKLYFSSYLCSLTATPSPKLYCHACYFFCIVPKCLEDNFSNPPHPPFSVQSQACWLENRLFLMDKNVFSAEYLNWVCDLTSFIPPPKTPHTSFTNSAGGFNLNGGEGVLEEGTGAECGYSDDGYGGVGEVEISAAKVALYLALDTVARAKNKERLTQLMLYVKSWFRSSPSVCRWVLEQARATNTTDIPQPFVNAIAPALFFLLFSRSRLFSSLFFDISPLFFAFFSPYYRYVL